MSPSRSTKITIVNQTGHDLSLTNSSLSHGEWTQSLSPPTTISNGSSGIFQAESDGVMTGDQGSANYSVNTVNDAIYKFCFDNPYAGSDNYDGTTAPSGYSYTQSGGGGNNAEVTFTCTKLN